MPSSPGVLGSRLECHPLVPRLALPRVSPPTLVEYPCHRPWHYAPNTMRMKMRVALRLKVLSTLLFSPSTLIAGGHAKLHTIGLGVGKHVAYSITADPAGAGPDEKTLHVRPLIVDDKVKEWTTGEAHDITDRSFVVRRALRLNDSLPGDKAEHWIWQRGPWIMIDRNNGHVTAIKLPDYDPAVSQITWFRDYAAYCGLNSGGHQLYAVVAQVAAHRPILAKKVGPWTPGVSTTPACAKATWQRDPLRVSFTPTGVTEPMNFNLVGLSAVLIEDGDADDTGSAGGGSN
jgi:hypothetical protein